ncbi:transposase, partial [Pasteurella multocida]
LPKIGWVRYRNSREIVGEVKKCHRFNEMRTLFL